MRLLYDPIYKSRKIHARYMYICLILSIDRRLCVCAFSISWKVSIVRESLTIRENMCFAIVEIPLTWRVRLIYDFAFQEI